MPTCVAIGCRNSGSKHEPGVSFHKFPIDSLRRKQWIHAVRRKNWQPSKVSSLCSKHFVAEQIDRSSFFCTRLRENAVPTIFWSHGKYGKNKDSDSTESDVDDVCSLPKQNEEQDCSLVTESVQEIQRFGEKSDTAIYNEESNILTCDEQLDAAPSDEQLEAESSDEQLYAEPSDEQLAPEPSDEQLNLGSSVFGSNTEVTDMQTDSDNIDVQSIALTEITFIPPEEIEKSVTLNKKYHALLLATVRTLRDKLDKSNSQKDNYKHRIKTLQQKVRRYERKVRVLKTALNDCTCKRLFEGTNKTDELYDLPVEENELFSIMKIGKRK